MGKGKRIRTQRDSQRAAQPLRARVVLGDIHLATAMAVVRPALLYADEVIVHAPAASMLLTLGSLRDVKDPLDQLDFIMSVARSNPTALGHLDIDLDTFEQMRAMLSIDRVTLRRVVNDKADRRALDDFYEQVDGMRDLFGTSFGQAMDAAVESAGAQELISAAEAGLLRVEPLSDVSQSKAMSSVIDAATGGNDGQDISTQVALSVVAATMEALSDPSHIPMLDEGAAGLAQSLRNEGLVSTSHPGHRDIATVAGLMSELPNLTDAPTDVLVALRRDLRAPLVRFRAAVSKMSAGFSSAVYDQSLGEEVSLAWRQEVAPALLDIEEGLREASVLRSAVEVGMNNPTKLAQEIGGTLLVGHAAMDGLSSSLINSLAAGIPVADATVRALHRTFTTRRETRRNDFYFLHAAEVAASEG